MPVKGAVAKEVAWVEAVRVVVVMEVEATVEAVTVGADKAAAAVAPMAAAARLAGWEGSCPTELHRVARGRHTANQAKLRYCRTVLQSNIQLNAHGRLNSEGKTVRQDNYELVDI